MVIGQLNIPCIAAFKAEDDPPVGAHRQRPEAPQVAFERVQAITRQIESLRRVGSIEESQNFLDGIDKVSPDTAAVPSLIKTFRPRCLKLRITADDIVMCQSTLIKKANGDITGSQIFQGSRLQLGTD